MGGMCHFSLVHRRAGRQTRGDSRRRQFSLAAERAGCSACAETVCCSQRRVARESGPQVHSCLVPTVRTARRRKHAGPWMLPPSRRKSWPTSRRSFSASASRSRSPWSLTSARAISCSKTCPASPRRCSPAPSPAASAARSSACNARPICCRPTSPASRSSTRRRRSSSSGPARFSRKRCSADEINRTTPRTQSALLEAMAERRVTADGQTYTLKPPFLVIATQNPVDHEGTFPLPEAQLDRFLVRLSLGYPSHGGRGEDAPALAAAAIPSTI